MPDLTLQSGETIAALAERDGLFAETIWNHPNNAGLRAKRQRIDALAPGDVLFIPERTAREESLAIDQRHRFVRKGVPAKIRLQLRENGQPRAHQPYVIEVAGRRLQGSTDGDGVLESFVPATATEATLHLGAADSPPITLRLGGMQADNTLGGVRRRLNNLGIEAPENGDLSSVEWRLALWRVQRLLDLPRTTRLDAATRQALLKAHDIVGKLGDEGAA